MVLTIRVGAVGNPEGSGVGVYTITDDTIVDWVGHQLAGKEPH